MSASNRLGDVARRRVLQGLRGRLSDLLAARGVAAPVERGAPQPALAMGDAAVRPEGSPPIGLSVVFVQYDRRKYAGALERLIAVLSRFESVGYSIVVVDNLRPGTFVHQLDDRVTHIGGDNSSWEFSAFDRGLAYLDGIGARARVYALVTDAFAAYGDSFLSLIDPSLIPFVMSRKAAVGWCDAWPEETTIFGKRYRDWVRTSFALLPEAALAAARPLAAPIDRAAVFSGDPTSPFAKAAELGENLERYLTEWLSGAQGNGVLTEGWHSRFRLDKTSLGFFEQKAQAILREHLLSVRLREAKIPCYDFRLVERIRASGRPLDAIDEAALSRFEGARWNAADDDEVLCAAQSHLDRVELPQVVTHGEPVEASVIGWVLSRPQPKVVRLHLGAEQALTLPCKEVREDVAQAFPAYGTAQCGFSIRASLADLTPGAHDVTLDIGEKRRLEVGRIEVLPAFSFKARRAVVPGSWPLGKPIPFSVEGELFASFRAESFSASVDGTDVEGDTFLSEGARVEHDLFVHEVAVNGLWTAPGRTAEHALELVFTLSSGATESWAFPFKVVPAEVACTLRRLHVGPYDPDTSLTTVSLDMDLFDAEPGDRLVLERAGVEILDRAVVENGAKGSAGARRIAINFERPVQGIPGGKNQLALLLKRGQRRTVLWQGETLVRYQHPEIHLERLTATLIGNDHPPTQRIHVTGWIKNHFLVDCLFIEIGGSRAAVIGLHEFRPDVAKAHGNSLVTRQGFDAVVDAIGIAPGQHTVHVIATQLGGERARVSQRVLFEDAPSRSVSVTSDDLERLLHSQEVQFYSAITLRGVVTTQMENAVATLVVGDKLADEQPLEGEGRHEFSLRAVPKVSGDYEVRFLVSSRGRIVFATDPVRVAYRTLEFADGLSNDLGVLLDRFDLRSKIVGHPTDRELVSRLVECQPERVPDFVGMLADAGRRIRTATPGRRSVEPVAHTARRRLKVLFASWEVPSRYHGGGVYLMNLLSRLGELHDVTLVHTYGIDEVGHSDALLRHVKRIIPVPRRFASSAYRGDRRFPLHLYDVYIPELRRVLELEVASGEYDLVDYEYTAMGPYVVAGVPSVLTIHETGYTALLNSAFDRPRSMESSVQDLDRLVRSFHYFTSELPKICDQLITLTEEDAAAITTFSNASVYTNSGGVEVDESSVRKARERGAPPVLAYVGNFQHPPNVRAARFFAQEVMPDLVQQYPQAEFRIYGGRIPAEIREFDGKNGVRVMDFVDDLRTALKCTTALVAPIFTGTGMRIKVLEALGAGALVIGTDLSMRGLAAVDRRHFYRANTASEFIRAVARAVEHPAEALAISQAGQDLVASMHGWDAVVRRREAIWHSAVLASESGAPMSEARRATAE